jgi:two-component system chemotaxis response regulator CheY
MTIRLGAVRQFTYEERAQCSSRLDIGSPNAEDNEETMHALVVDDSRATRSVLRRMLERLGYTVAEAADGPEALAHIQAGPPPTLVLVDWNMPTMNGLELVKAVRASHAYDGVCLVMVTTETDLSHVTDALGAGANEYIMKPFTEEILLEKLAIVGLPEA